MGPEPVVSAGPVPRHNARLGAHSLMRLGLMRFG